MFPKKCKCKIDGGMKGEKSDGKGIRAKEGKEMKRKKEERDENADEIVSGVFALDVATRFCRGLFLPMDYILSVDTSLLLYFVALQTYKNQIYLRAILRCSVTKNYIS
jgi:hypothetical protein